MGRYAWVGARIAALPRRGAGARAGYLIVKIRAVPRQSRPRDVFIGGVWGGYAAG